MPIWDDTWHQTGMYDDADTIVKYSDSLPYRVLRKDTSVHGVEDIPSGTRAFSVFEHGNVDELICGCSPAMVMYSTANGIMTLSVSNPDLALYEGPSDEVYDENGKRLERSVYGRKWIDNPCGETTVTITLAGEWEISDKNGCEVSATYDNGRTTLVFKSKEARTEEIILCQK